MGKPRDFAADLEAISATVNRDVGTIMKIVREKQSTAAKKQIETSTRPDTQDQALVSKQPKDEPTFQPTPIRRAVSKQRARTAHTLAEYADAVLENVTTRLPRDTNERLTDAALRQRLKKVEPATRQDIINEALKEWLERKGYS